MGLFSSSSKTYVFSSVSNLAGELNLRPDIMKTAVISAVLSGGKSAITQSIMGTLLYGPFSKHRQYLNWARDNFIFGLPQATVQVSKSVSTEAVATGVVGLIPVEENGALRILSAKIDDADIHYWAEAWMMANSPTLDSTSWNAEWDIANSEIAIYPNETDTIRISAPADLVWGGSVEGRKLLYVLYAVLVTDPVTGEVSQSAAQLFTYRMGTGNVVLDTLQAQDQWEPEFFPAIPVRLNKTFLDETTVPTGVNGAYDNAQKAFKKLTGGKMPEMVDEIKEAGDMKDVSDIFVVQGVSLNTEEQVGRKYIYQFFKLLSEKQYPESLEVPILPRLPNQSETQRYVTFSTWLAAQKKATGGKYGNSLVKAARPESGNGNESSSNLLAKRNSSTYEIRIYSPVATSKYDVRLGWESIIETNHVGNAMAYDGDTSRGKLGVGRYWFDAGKGKELLTPVFNMGIDGVLTYKYLPDSKETVNLFHQVSKYRYRRITCHGLVHRNLVYRTHSVWIKGKAALEDEEESGFLVPLHYPTLKSMGPKGANQLSMSSNYLVFNSYKIVKIKWYQKGIFKVILMIAVVAISFIFPPAGGFAAQIGILGTNATVGATLGLAGAAAALAGAAVNAIAGMIVTTLISSVSTEIFGEKIGAIIGTIASFVAMSYGTHYAATGNFNLDWGQMMKSVSITQMTTSVTKAYTTWLNVETAEIYESFSELGDEYEEKMREIKDMTAEILGMTNGVIDPMMFTDAPEHFGETSEAFLTRTLLTGSDIAMLSHSMIENFVELSLEIPKAVFPT